LGALRLRYQNLPAVTVFYQVWQAPLMTLNGQHLVSQAISLCGGVNIFAGLAPLAPTVSAESVLAADPETIVTGAGADSDPLAAWRRYGALKAVRQNNLITLDADTMTRAGPRVLDGTELLCKALVSARQRRG
jgi:iron complex transport system substrate-binding protein